MEMPVCNITDYKNLIMVQQTLNMLEYKQQSFIKILWENLTISEDDIYVDKSVLENIGMTIDNLKSYLDIRVIHNCRYLDNETNEWVGKLGYWIHLKK